MYLVYCMALIFISRFVLDVFYITIAPTEFTINRPWLRPTRKPKVIVSIIYVGTLWLVGFPLSVPSRVTLSSQGPKPKHVYNFSI